MPLCNRGVIDMGLQAIKSQKGKVPRLESEDSGLTMEEVRCPKCGRFLLYQAIVVGALKVKCPNCKSWATLDIIPPPDIIEDEVEEVSRPNS